jgi:hypothetical protein
MISAALRGKQVLTSDTVARATRSSSSMIYYIDIQFVQAAARRGAAF